MNDTVIASAPAATQTATRTPTNGTPDVRPTNPQASVAADGFKASLQKTLSASLAEAFPPVTRPAAPADSGTEPSPETPETAPATTPPPTAEDAPNVPTPAEDTAEPPEAPEASDAANLTKALKAERAEKKRIRQELAQLKAQLKTAPAPEAAAPETPERATEGAKRTPQDEVKHLTNVVGRIKGWLRTAQSDPERVVAELKALNMPVTHDSVQDWLSAQLDTYGDQLMDAKVEERFAREVNGYQERNTRQTAEQAAAQWVPELENPDSPEAQRFAELQSKHPGLADDPLATALLAAAVLGFKTIEGKGKSTTPPAAPARPAANGAAVILPKRNGTPRPAVDGAAPVNGDVSVSASQLLQRYATSGSDGDKSAFKRVYGLGLLGRMVRK